MYTKEELKALEEMQNIVYAISNLVTGRVVYVGKTLHTWNERYNASDDLIGAKRITNNNVNYLVVKQIEKYGVDNFKIDIVYTLNTTTKDFKTRHYVNVLDNVLLNEEFFYMVKFDTFSFDDGCNIDYDIKRIDYVLSKMDRVRSKKEKRRMLVTLVKCLMNSCLGRFGVHSRFLMNDNMQVILDKWNEVNDKKPKLLADNIVVMLSKMGLNTVAIQKSHRHGQYWYLDKYYEKESKPLTKIMMVQFKRSGRKLNIIEIESTLQEIIGINYILNRCQFLTIFKCNL